MDYRVIEAAYGPDIRFNDWQVAEGRAASAGAALHLFGEERGQAMLNPCHLGGGGDVEQALIFNFERLEADGNATVHFNCQPKQEDNGFRLRLDGEQLTVILRDEQVAQRPHAGCDRAQPHEIRLATLAEAFVLHYNGEVLAEGNLASPARDNEGRIVVAAEQADVRVTSCSESFIAHDIDAPSWQRTELLYEEAFGSNSFAENWCCNRQLEERLPTCEDGAYTFHWQTNNLLRTRFNGPLAMDCVITPAPVDRFCAGITDAIVIWMLDRSDGDLFEFFDAKTAAAEAGLNLLLPMPLYWVDFGGSNNITTRLRRNPGRRLVRQFTDRQRLLERYRSYRITTVQNGHFLEFWVDGELWIQTYDPVPLTSGYVGFRAYIADLKVEDLKVWRIAE